MSLGQVFTVYRRPLELLTQTDQPASTIRRFRVCHWRLHTLGALNEHQALSAAAASNAKGSPPIAVRWNLSDGRAVRRGRSARRRADRRRRAARLPDRAAHRPLAERQVRRPRAVERSATSRGARSTGRWSRRSSTRCTSDMLALARRARSSSSRTATPAPIRQYRLPVRVITEYAWHNLFARNLFIVPPAADLAGFQPQFTVIDAPSFKADPARHGTRSDVVIALNFGDARSADRRHQLRRRDQEVDLHAC